MEPWTISTDPAVERQRALNEQRRELETWAKARWCPICQMLNGLNVAWDGEEGRWFVRCGDRAHTVFVRAPSRLELIMSRINEERGL